VWTLLSRTRRLLSSCTVYHSRVDDGTWVSSLKVLQGVGSGSDFALHVDSQLCRIANSPCRWSCSDSLSCGCALSKFLPMPFDRDQSRDNSTVGKHLHGTVCIKQYARLEGKHDRSIRGKVSMHQRPHRTPWCLLCVLLLSLDVSMF